MQDRHLSRASGGVEEIISFHQVKNGILCYNSGYDKPRGGGKNVGDFRFSVCFFNMNFFKSVYLLGSCNFRLSCSETVFDSLVNSL